MHLEDGIKVVTTPSFHPLLLCLIAFHPHNGGGWECRPDRDDVGCSVVEVVQDGAVRRRLDPSRSSAVHQTSLDQPKTQYRSNQYNFVEIAYPSKTYTALLMSAKLYQEAGNFA